jgi:DNA polymerase-3 subunit alpha
MGGMISAYKKLKTKSGAFMAFVTVEDLYGSVECVCFPKVYEKIRSFLEADKVVSVDGKMSIDAEKLPAIIVDRMTEFSLDEKPPIAKAAAVNREGETARPIVKAEKPDKDKKLWLNVSDLDEADIEELMETLTFYEGETPVVFVKNGKKMLCSQKVNPNKALIAELFSFLPENCIKLV